MIINTSLLNPLFIVFFISFSVFLYLLRLSTQFDVPSSLTVTYLSISISCMLLGMLIGMRRVLKGQIKVMITSNIGGRLKDKRIKVESVAAFLCVISTIAYIFEHFVFYKNYGSIPIFNVNFEVLRINFPVSGYIHIIALSGFVSLLFIYYECLNRKLEDSRISSGLFKFFLVFSIIHVLLSLAVGNRGVIAYFFLQCFLVRSVFYKVPLVRIFLVSFVFLYALGLAKFYRDFLFVGDSIYSDISKVWWFGDSVFLAPFYYVYVTLCMNFEILNQYVNSNFDFFMGYFTFILPFDSLLSGDAYELIDFQKDVLNVDFHGVLTATGFGVPYFDFGLGGVVLSFFISAMFGSVYYFTFVRANLFLIPFYVYFFSTLLTFVYTYNFNKLYVIIYLLILLFLGCLSKHRYRRI
ncbi:hypothetical protein DC365_02840 [Vibrio vulnificus]|uniref:O-antigen polymerase n=1 Tax=Vibrio vulnificus TaxID=672 RepID=UPI000D3E1341|nr:O-antigen polymerase [Vibrio vulnificus]PVA00057.1 hypothetical protein DC365_02840 [Vibrio vulnificus]